MLIVTGGAGFIGSNLVRELNRRGRTDLLVVDDLEHSEKYQNLADLVIQDYMDRREFRARIEAGRMKGSFEAILHNGACTNTMETDGRRMLDHNFGDSKAILDFAISNRVPFVYASSAAIYGRSRDFQVDPRNECPLNLYGWSKLVFDQHVRSRIAEAESTLVGLRYFNVYGPREQHKGQMMSVLHQLLAQLRSEGVCRLFEGTDGFAHGEQVRDFIFVEDIVNILLFFADGPLQKGIYNAGTGEAHSFNTIANTLIHLLGQGRIEYIPFPENLRGHYQSYTQANLVTLRAAGYDRPFTPLETGIQKTLMALGD